MGLQTFKNGKLKHFIHNIKETMITKERIQKYFLKSYENKSRFHLLESNIPDIDFEIKTKSFCQEEMTVGYLKIDKNKKLLYLFSIDKAGIPIEFLLDIEIYVIKEKKMISKEDGNIKENYFSLFEISQKHIV